MTHQGAEAAVEQLEGLAEGGGLRLAPEEQVLQLLCRATLHLLAGDVTATSAALEQLNPLIEAGSSSGGAGGSEGEAAGGGGSLLYKQLRCHYQVLYVSMVVVAGRINDLKQGGLHSCATACAGHVPCWPLLLPQGWGPRGMRVSCSPAASQQLSRRPAAQHSSHRRSPPTPIFTCSLLQTPAATS